jgi:hypothetical protein
MPIYKIAPYQEHETFKKIRLPFRRIFFECSYRSFVATLSSPNLTRMGRRTFSTPTRDLLLFESEIEI